MSTLGVGISSSISWANTNSSILDAKVHFPLKPALILVSSLIVSLSTNACKLDKEFTVISEPFLSMNL